MPYSTLADILERIAEKVVIQLTDDDRLGVVDQGKVDAAIARADKEIDAWCGNRYTVPFADPPAVIREISADLAVYHLYARKVDKLPETRVEGQKNALRLLEKISDGKVSLGTAQLPPAAPAAVSGGASFVAPDRVFTRDTLKDM
jgi:phage gp36-like protein